MPDRTPTLTLTLHPRIAEIDAAEWDACAGDDNPFVSHAFLSAIEDSGSATARTGWLPQHAALRDARGRLVAAAPMYAKSHSYGEYVFDHGWAQALERAGGSYYPKLQVAVPFSPVPGPRLLRRPDGGDRRSAALAAALEQACRELDLSSVHVTFCRRTSGRRWARPAGCSGSACSSIGKTRAMPASTISSARCRRASARCCGGSGGTPTPPA